MPFIIIVYYINTRTTMPLLETQMASNKNEWHVHKHAKSCSSSDPITSLHPLTSAVYDLKMFSANACSQIEILFHCWLSIHLFPSLLPPAKLQVNMLNTINLAACIRAKVYYIHTQFLHLNFFNLVFFFLVQNIANISIQGEQKFGN